MTDYTPNTDSQDKSKETLRRLTPPCGPVVGQIKKGISVFKGIPYAKPPVGELRFRPPQRRPVWTEPLECFEFGDRCLQYGGILADLTPMYTSEGKSEDCLYLNVWTPAKRYEDAYPVYVYIHGGGFATGSGSEIMFDGASLAKRGVVVVTLNYRLGALGFLALEALRQEIGTTGNYGLMDQILALTWVKENIASFGGDPDNVTLGGESAGAFSVTGLLLSPAAQGLFHRAVIESGAILSIGAFCQRTQGNLDKSIAMGKELAAIFGASDSPEGLEILRALPPEALAHLSMIKSDQNLPLRFSFWPVFDGVLLPADPMAALRHQKFNAVDLLLGYNTNESTLFIKNTANTGAYVTMIYDIFGPEGAAKIFERFPLSEEKQARRVLEELFTITGFTLGMRIFADYFAEAGKSVYFYNFNYDPAILKIVGLDTAHALELPFVFGNLLGGLPFGKISALSDQMQTHWTNFMKNGDPNVGDIYKNTIYWPEYQKNHRQMMVFDTRLSTAVMPGEEQLDFIEALLFGENPRYL
ncbi:MAG: carboxylesterase family protein [Eubacterium sp.]|nr:carboxylesterase family protein [Eubacterium sp.]